MTDKSAANTGYANYANLIFLAGFVEPSGNFVDIIGAASGVLAGTTTGRGTDGTHGEFVNLGSDDSRVNFGDANVDNVAQITQVGLFQNNADSIPGGTADSQTAYSKEGGGADACGGIWLNSENWLAYASATTAQITDGLDNGAVGDPATDWNVIGQTCDGTNLTARVNAQTATASFTASIPSTAHDFLIGNVPDFNRGWLGKCAGFAVLDTGLDSTEWADLVADYVGELFAAEAGDSNATLETESASYAAESDAAFSANITSPVNFSAAAESADAEVAVAQVTSLLIAAAESNDTKANISNVLSLLQANGEASELVTALATAAAAIVDGAESGEAWVATVQALVNLQAGAISDDDLQKIVEGLSQESISEGAESLSQFVASIRTIAVLTNAASSAAALASTATAICILATQAESGDTWVGTDLGILSITKTILEAAESSGLFVVTGQAIGRITAGVLSSATFEALGHSISGYLVASAITIVAQLSASSISITPELTGTPTLEPNT